MSEVSNQPEEHDVDEEDVTHFEEDAVHLGNVEEFIGEEVEYNLGEDD